MKTEHLITILSQDTARGPSPARAVTSVVLAALVVSGSLMVATMGMRPDVTVAAIDPAVWLKSAFVTALVIAGAWAAGRAGQPGRSSRPGLAVGAGAVIIMLAVAALDLVRLAPELWTARVLGSNWLVCLVSVPLLALPAMAALVLALRQLAPTDLAAAGALVGFAGGAIGAFAYALHCTNDAAPFVVTWYLLAIAVTTLIGRLAGPHLLRW